MRLTKNKTNNHYKDKIFYSVKTKVSITEI